MKLSRSGIIAYEANDNIYINLANKCTAECVFCTKRYFAKRYFDHINDNAKGNNSQYSKQLSTEDILKKLESYDLSKYNEKVFTGMGEPLTCLDEVIYGYLRSSNEPVYGYQLHLLKEPSIEEIIKELESYDFSKYNEAVFTGMGEPLTGLDVVIEITKWLTRSGIPVRLDTIGHAKFLYPERNVAKELADSGMKKVSVSLNAHDEATYNLLCRPKFENAYFMMLEFAREITKAGMELRFTIVDLPIVNTEKCRQIARKYGADFMTRIFF